MVTLKLGLWPDLIHDKNQYFKSSPINRTKKTVYYIKGTMNFLFDIMEYPNCQCSYPEREKCTLEPKSKDRGTASIPVFITVS